MKALIKILLLIFGCLFTGLLMITMGFTEPDFSIGSRIFSIVCGLLFILASLAFYGINASELKEFREKRKERKEKWKNRKNIFENAPKAQSKNDTETKLETFRESLANFFAFRNIKENSQFQNETTQLFWNVMVLKKKRLDKKGINMELVTERKKYENITPVKSISYFDGKYAVSEFDETLAVRESYLKNGITVLTKVARRIGHSVITNAQSVSGQKVICPNCGAHSTKEDLIDGCDYCGTKFKVEDLGKKVSSFRMREDYELRYAEYKIARSHFNTNIFWGQFAVYTLIFILVTICSKNFMLDSDENILVNLFALPLAAALMGGMFAFLGLFIFWPVIFPIIQIFYSTSFYSQKKLEGMKKQTKHDLQTQEKIRKYDPLFSINAFYSNIQNKLAAVHFADTPAGINAFFISDSNDLNGVYSNVINMDLIKSKITDYKVNDEIQQITVEADVLLDEENNGYARSRKESIQLQLEKDAKCKTQEICGPSVFTCKGCGASLALEDGKTCPQCSKVMNLREVDWVIRKYKIK